MSNDTEQQLEAQASCELTEEEKKEEGEEKKPLTAMECQEKRAKERAANADS